MNLQALGSLSGTLVYARFLVHLSVQGFWLHLRTFCSAILCARRNGCIWMGVLCSSWVSIAKGSTRRTFANPEGWASFPSVANGNYMAGRWAFLGLRGNIGHRRVLHSMQRSRILYCHISRAHEGRETLGQVGIQTICAYIGKPLHSRSKEGPLIRVQVGA